MTSALVFITYAGLLTTLGPRLLTHQGWADRAPRLAIVGWQSLSAAVMIAVLLAGLSVAVPSGLAISDLGLWIQACLIGLRDGYGIGVTGPLALMGTLSVFILVGRFVGCLLSGACRQQRARHQHQDSLTLLARRDPALDAIIIENGAALAYCLPGYRRRIVLTTAALDELSEAELQAVLAHERAHLTGRHHLVIALADSCARAFPRLALFRQAREEIARLLEMLADDAASKRHGRLAVATAIAALAGRSVPAAALAAGGDTALVRARRLLAPAQPLRGRFLLGGFLLAAAAGLLPIVFAITPAFGATGNPACLQGQTQRTHSYSPLPRLPNWQNDARATPPAQAAQPASDSGVCRACP